MTGMLNSLFNLRRDQDDPESIDTDIRAGSRPTGTNLWVLFFAILIASVGLNVNSTAVIIGAMLVSPLMGPIQAIGYGAAVQDLKLIREGAMALAVFTGLSLLTSTLYFTISPLAQAGNELLARTTPTLWDVLIASFGGAAGMVAATRKDVSNVVPGVAIATALMPPLCTVGFGLAHSRWDMVGGAFYLFLINGVFIAVGSLAISKLLRLPLRGSLEPSVRTRHRWVIGTGIATVLIPSIWFGYRSVQHEIFTVGAHHVAEALHQDPHINVVAQELDPKSFTLRLTLLGTFDESQVQQMAQALFKREGIAHGRLELRRAGDAPLDVGTLREQLEKDLDRTVLQRLRSTDARLQAVDQAIANLQNQQTSDRQVDAANLRDEVRAQLPQVTALTLAYGARAAANEQATEADAVQDAVVIVEHDNELTASQSSALQRWLNVRLGPANVKVIHQNGAASAEPIRQPDE